MNFFRKTINNFTAKIKHFPEFHLMIEAQEGIRRNEQAIATGQQYAFTNLKVYGDNQHESLPDALGTFADAGNQQVSIETDVLNSLSSFTNDLQPLLQQEMEIFKWRQVLETMKAEAEKSEAAAAKAKQYYDKMSASNGSKLSAAETDYNAKQRKAEDDRKNVEQQQAKLEVEERPYQAKFLENYMTSVNAMLQIRLSAAEKLVSLASEYQNGVDKIQEISEPTNSMKKLHEDLEKYNQIVIE